MLGDAKLANCVNLSRRIPAVVQKQQMSWRSTTIELRPESEPLTSRAVGSRSTAYSLYETDDRTGWPRYCCH